VNRQAYSQGYVYLVESFTWQHSTPPPAVSSVNVISLPTSWTVYQSWKKAKRLWDKMNRQPGVVLPAYHDYKVFMDAVHYQAHVDLITNLLPVDGSLAAFSNVGREWQYAQYVGYGDTRTTVGLEEPELPGDASTSWQTELFDEGETFTDLVNHLEGHNDQPPYAHALDAQGGDDPIYVGGSVVPLGLLNINGTNGGKLTINLAPGVYKGIAAMPMGKVST